MSTCPSFDVSGRAALVTGAARGLGEAIALASEDLLHGQGDAVGRLVGAHAET
jgi:NAD(P)-dependent dehydrogenase (short-subunit alcohol dehydrogenase family)